MKEMTMEQKVNNLEKTVKSFKHEIERLQAINEIQNLMSRYEYLHMTNRNPDVIELYAKKVSDVRVSIKEMGYWEGRDAAQRAWGINPGSEDGYAGAMGIHPTTTPMIVIARDGKTAKGVWIGTGLVAGKDKDTGKPKCGWEWDRYGVDFIKEDGKWKFWHFHIYTLFSSGWDDPWAEQFNQKVFDIVIPDNLKPDGLPIDSYPYRPDMAVQLIPVPPEPYETWGKE